MIRKISIGLDLKNSMTFYINQELFKGYIVHCIEAKKDGSFDLWLKNEGEIVKWKNFNNNLPIAVEYNIDF